MALRQTTGPGIDLAKASPTERSTAVHAAQLKTQLGAARSMTAATLAGEVMSQSGRSAEVTAKPCAARAGLSSRASIPFPPSTSARVMVTPR